MTILIEAIYLDKILIVRDIVRKAKDSINCSLINASFYLFTVMSLEEARRTQRPYRYGMILLCLGALVNWLGLAENYSEPVRYAGVACILSEYKFLRFYLKNGDVNFNLILNIFSGWITHLHSDVLLATHT